MIKDIHVLTLDNITEPWSAFRHATPTDHNYGRLIAHNSTHLQWQQVTTKDVQTIDEFWIIQNDHGPFISKSDADCHRKGETSNKEKSCAENCKVVT